MATSTFKTAPLTIGDVRHNWAAIERAIGYSTGRIEFTGETGATYTFPINIDAFDPPPEFEANLVTSIDRIKAWHYNAVVIGGKGDDGFLMWPTETGAAS